MQVMIREVIPGS